MHIHNSRPNSTISTIELYNREIYPFKFFKFKTSKLKTVHVVQNSKLILRLTYAD